MLTAASRLAVCVIAVSLASSTLITLSDRYTADPAPYVAGNRLYIYTSHDLADQRGWLMKDYSLMSTTDLVNFRDEGIVFDLANQTWGEYAWAQQVIGGEDGKFYMYYPAMNVRPGDPQKRSGTGVAVSDSITGPFNDALGKPILACGDDPTVFRDDDGAVYLCGNCGGPLCAQLHSNMTALATAPALLSPALPEWFEAPWLWKWRGVYYLSYMCAGDNRTRGLGNFSHFGWDLCYGSSLASPLGPYVFRGSLMWSPAGNCGATGGDCSAANDTAGDNNHQGIVEFPAGSGRLYLAYHTRLLARSRGAYVGFQRNVALDRMYARGDAGVYPLPASLPWVVNETVAGAGPGLLPVTSTPAWLRQLAYVDAYGRIPGTLSAMMSAGLDTEPCAEGGRNLGFISAGATLTLRGVDFGAAPGAASVTLRVASPLAGGAVTVLLDGAPAGPPCAVPNTGDWQRFANVTCALAPGAAVGVAANLTLLFSGPGTGGLFNLLFYSFLGGAASGALPPPVTAALALRSTATARYACAANDAGALVTPSGAAPCRWTAHDLEDGTWALSTATAAGERFACKAAGAAPLAATEPAPGAPCTRFWLYGTPVGSFALLSAGAGKFLTASTADAPILAEVDDPRIAVADGARFFLDEVPAAKG